MSLPKVLIINQPFNNNTGGGITLSNLFCNWEREKLAVACSGYLLNKEMDSSLCNNYYQLGSKERKLIFPLNLFSRKYYSGPVNIDRTADIRKKVVVEKSKFRVRLIHKYMLPFFDYMGFSHFQAKTKLSAEFCKWLDDFSPDVIYAQASMRESILFCLEVHDYLKRPMVFHMMDDWPSLIAVKGPMKKFWKRKIEKEFKLLLDSADLLLSISDYMAEEYQKRYKKKFITFHNPIDLKFWKKRQRDNYDLTKSSTLLYAGRIGLGIDKSLKNIAETVKNINGEFDSNINLIIQSQDAPIWIKNYKNVEHKRFVKYDDLPAVFSKADFLILPYDFSVESLSYIKYSMPTKASEYMASGTPIIIFAPQDTALVKYAEKYHWAAVVTENNVDILTGKLKKLLINQSLREEIANTAKRIAETRHDSEIVARRFEQMISNVAENKKMV